VILVEDVVNTGLTLDYLMGVLGAREAGLTGRGDAAWTVRRGAWSTCGSSYIGFQIPNDFVVGYGLDYRELYRNLPFICCSSRRCTRGPAALPLSWASGSLERSAPTDLPVYPEVPYAFFRLPPPTWEGRDFHLLDVRILRFTVLSRVGRSAG